MKDSEEVIIDGDFEEIQEFRNDNEEHINKMFNDSISMIGEPPEEDEEPSRDVIQMSDLSEDEIKRIEDSHMDPKHDHLNAELEDPTAPRKKMTQREIFNAITAAHRSGAITSKDKTRLMRDMGVFKSEFTQKKTTKTSKNKKRKNQKSARRKNR